MRKMKATTSIMLVIVMLLSVFSVASVNVRATTILTEDQFLSKLESAKDKYKTGLYWNDYNGQEQLNGKTVSKVGNNVCKGVSATDGKSCVSHGYCAWGSAGYCTCTCGQVSGYGYQCFGYANLMCLYVWGSCAIYRDGDAGTVNTSAGWSYVTSPQTVYAGDYVRLTSTHSIFITKISGNTVYYTDCNRIGPCMISWDGSYSMSDLLGRIRYVVRMQGNTITGDGTHAPSYSYKITYNLNDGTVVTANPTTYNEETPTFTLNNPTKTGYTFTGWTGSNGTTPQRTVTIEKGSTGDKTYTAQWAIISSTVTVNPNGGSWTHSGTEYKTPKEFTSDYNTTLTVELPTRIGYTFTGWTFGGDKNGKFSASTTGNSTYTFGLQPKKNDTLTASWLISYYKLTVIPNGGEWENSTDNQSFPMNYNSTKKFQIQSVQVIHLQVGPLLEQVQHL